MNAQTPSLKIGVVAAMAAEAALLPARGVRPGQLASMEGGHVLILSGMGPVAAAVAAEQLVAADVQALLVFGVAGALDPRLRNGELCCPASVVDEHGQRHLCDRVWREQLLQRLLPSGLGWHPRQQLLSVEQPLLTGDDKSAAFARGCVAVDMESAAVAAVAARHGLPLLVLRAIVDEANDSIPQALNGSVDVYGRPRMLGLLAALGRQPSLCAELPRLYSRMQGATRSLRSAARAAGPSWAWPH